MVGNAPPPTMITVFVGTDHENLNEQKFLAPPSHPTAQEFARLKYEWDVAEIDSKMSTPLSTAHLVRTSAIMAEALPLPPPQKYCGSKDASVHLIY